MASLPALPRALKAVQHRLRHILPVPLRWNVQYLGTTLQPSMPNIPIPTTTPTHTRPPLPLTDLPIHRQRTRDHPTHIPDIPRHHHGGSLLRQPAKRINIFLRDAQPDRALRRVFPLLDRVADRFNPLGRRVRFQLDRLRLTARRVDLLPLQRLRRKNNTLLPSLSDIDRALPLPLGFQDLRAFAALGRDLSMHGGDDAVGRVDVADLVAETGHAPVLRGFVDGLGDVVVEVGAFFEDMVEGKLADFGAHGGLGELGDGVFGVFDAVAVVGLGQWVGRRGRGDL